MSFSKRAATSEEASRIGSPPPPPKKIRTTIVPAPEAIVSKPALTFRQLVTRDEELPFNAKGQPVQLSPAEISLGIPPALVKDLQYGDRLTSFLGFPLLSFPSDPDGLAITYDSTTGHNVFYTPTKGHDVIEDKKLPSAMAEAARESPNFTVQWIRLVDLVIYLVVSLTSYSHGKFDHNLDLLADLISGNKTLSASSLCVPRVNYYQTGGRPLSKLPSEEVQRLKKIFGEDHPDIRAGKQPRITQISIQYVEYFKNGKNFPHIASAPITGKSEFDGVAILYEVLGEKTIDSTRRTLEAQMKGKAVNFEVKNPDMVYYRSKYAQPNKTLIQVAGELLNIPSWSASRGTPKVVLALFQYFSKWIEDPSKVFRGKKNPEPKFDADVPPVVNYLQPLADPKKKEKKKAEESSEEESAPGEDELAVDEDIKE